jgi:hypothetical protein
MAKKNLVFVLILFAVSLLVRLLFYQAFLRNNSMQLSFDSGQYHGVAVNISNGRGITNADGSPHFYRLPGYPLFLSMCYSVLGTDVDKTMHTQIVLASCIPALVFFLGLQWFPAWPAVAYGVGVVAAIAPGFVILSGLVFSETLFMLFFLLFLLFLFSQRCLFCAGTFVGAASLVRPVGLWLFVLVIGILFFTLHEQRLRKIALFFCGWFLFVGLWLLRNFLLAGAIFLHTLSGPHILNHGATRVYMQAHNTTYEAAKYVMNQKLDECVVRHSSKNDEYQHCVLQEQLAVKMLLCYPWQTIKLCVANALKTVMSLYSSELLFIDSGGQLPPYDEQRSVTSMVMRFLKPQVHNHSILYVIYFEMILHALLLCGVIGFMWVWRKNIVTYVPIILLIVLFVSLSCICGFARLRLPIEPFFIMLAMAFWMQVARGKSGYERIKKKCSRYWRRTSWFNGRIGTGKNKKF